MSEKDKRAAIKAYVNFLSDPIKFAGLYINGSQWLTSPEAGALELFAEYSTLHTSAERLILNSFTPAISELLQKAQLKNSFEPNSVTLAGGIILFRAMSMEEFNEFMSSGQFLSTAGNTMGGKWFAESAANANQWGIQFSKWSGEYRVVGVELDTNLANSFYRVGKLDGIGPARYADDLTALNNGIINYWEEK